MVHHGSVADSLWEPVKIGSLELKHRVVLAPLTRCRAIDTIPATAAAALYYSQRATEGGLLISEGTCISLQSHGYLHVPGIYTEAQLEAWKPIVKAVHDKGAKIFMQLWHVGRASHTDYQPGGLGPQAPSAIPVGEAWDLHTPKGGPFKFSVPREVGRDEIRGIVGEYAAAAKNAMEAGCDGVEIHAANGYLLAQFIANTTNTRTDEYGGSVENRCRLLFEVVEAVVAAVGDAGRVGVRLSPFNTFLDCIESDPYGTYGHVVRGLNKYRLAYCHMVEPRTLSYLNMVPLRKLISILWHTDYKSMNLKQKQTLEPFRKAFEGAFISAGGHDRTSAIKTVSGYSADLVAFGRWFISNPDLVLRLKVGAPLNPYNRDLFYTHDPVVGYTDYPALTDDEVEKIAKKK